jgi:hypothetical protein
LAIKEFFQSRLLEYIKAELEELDGKVKEKRSKLSGEWF